MNQLFAERLKSARMMNGLSLQDLSDKLGDKKVTRQALHKYEKGEVLPDSEMLGYLCDVLNVRPDYFTRENIVELGEINFRKLEKLPVKEQISIVERTKEILSRYIELEEIVGISKPFNHPRFKSPINSMEGIELAAKQVRENWKLGIDPISNAVELLEENNIKIIEIDSKDGFDGLQTWINDKDIPVIVLNIGRLKSSDRKRFTAFHELGHLLLPLDGIDEKLAEKYCHRFAGAMLFPKDALIKILGEKRNKLSIQELGILKQEYGISIQALIYRIRDLDIISEHYKNYYFQFISQMGWKIEEPYVYEGREISKRFDQLIFRALSEEIISMSKAASLKNMKLAEFRANTLVIG